MLGTVVLMMLISIAFAMMAQFVVMYISGYAVMLAVRNTGKERLKNVSMLLLLSIFTCVLWYNVSVHNWEFLLLVALVCHVSLIASERRVGGVYFGKQGRRKQSFREDK